LTKLSDKYKIDLCSAVVHIISDIHGDEKMDQRNLKMQFDEENTIWNEENNKWISNFLEMQELRKCYLKKMYKNRNEIAGNVIAISIILKNDKKLCKNVLTD
jgi:hypothetical protein